MVVGFGCVKGVTPLSGIVRYDESEQDCLRQVSHSAEYRRLQHGSAAVR
jgi:hypothetical protein